MIWVAPEPEPELGDPELELGDFELALLGDPELLLGELPEPLGLFDWACASRAISAASCWSSWLVVGAEPPEGECEPVPDGGEVLLGVVLPVVDAGFVVAGVVVGGVVVGVVVGVNDTYTGRAGGTG